MPPFRRQARHAKNAREQSKTTLLASAVLVKQSQIRAVPEQREWQTRAWEYFDQVGELRFASQWIANALSRCGLHVRSFTSEDSLSEPVPLEKVSDADPRAKVPLEELFDGPTGHPEMLSRFATHLTVCGESYLVGWDVDDGSGGVRRRWLVASSDEIDKGNNRVFKVRLPETDKLTTIDLDKATVIRLWRPHPRRAWEADSPVRAALPVLKELMDLSAHISATIESRLAGAGLLLLPESATLPSPVSGQTVGEPLHEDPAMATLIDAMVTPIQDRDSAAAVVPILVRVPDSAVGKAQWMSFSTKLDEKIQSLREDSIRRFSTVVDIPAEVMTGMAQANRWNAWKIGEDAVKIHLEPLLELICDALTVQYLWPALTAMGVTNPESYVIWYDASNLIQRPNKGPESQNLWEHGLVSTKTVLHANGFTGDDAPDKDEQKRNLLIQLATKGIDPTIVQPYLKALGIEIELPEIPVQRVDESSDPGTLSPGTRGRGRPALPVRLPTRPDALPANRDREEADAVAAAALPPLGTGGDLTFAALELGAVRALEVAGKRLLNNGPRANRGALRDVEPWAIHTHIAAADADKVLCDAYSVLQHCLPEHPCIHATIDAYVRERLALQAPHDRGRLLTMLADAGCLAGVSRVVA